MNKFIALFTLLALLAPKLAAQDTTFVFPRKELSFLDIKEPEKNMLEIVSASRSAKKISELPVTVYVITAEEIKRNGYVTLVDVLKMLPGIRVSQPGNAAQGETFLMRGFVGNYYTKILFNGLPIAPSVTGEMVIGPHLPIRQAQRIEVIYGPASALYGADATTGVINIITKEPKNSTFAESDIYIGDNGYTNYDFIVGGKAGKYKNLLEYSIYGNRSQIEHLNTYNDESIFSPLYFSQFYMQPLNFNGTNVWAYQLTDQVLAEYGLTQDILMSAMLPENYEGTLFVPQIDDMPEQSYSLGLNAKYRKFRLSFYHSYYQLHSSVGMLSYYYKYNNQMNFFGHHTSKVSLSYENSWRLFSFSSAVSYLHYNMDNYSSQGLTYMSNGLTDAYMYAQSDDIFLEHLLTFHPSEKFEIVAGISNQISANLPQTNYLTEPFEISSYSPFGENLLSDSFFGTFGYNPITFSNSAVFLQVFWKIKRFNFVAGLRFEENSLYAEDELFGQSMNPRFALTYRANPRWVLRASLATAIKAPSATKMYYSVALAAGQNNDSIEYAFIPNPQLSPEMFAALEFGFRYTIPQKIELDVSAYSNNLSNQIVAGMVRPEDMPELPRLVVGQRTFTRIYRNKKDVIASLFALQANLNVKKIVPSIQLGAELNFTLSQGTEILPETEEIIENFRQMPQQMGKLKLYATPARNLYINTELVGMGGWYRSYISSKANLPKDYMYTQGYWTQDVYASYNLSKQFKVFVNVKNIFDKQYAGIDATGFDIDMIFNPQLRRQIRIGANFSLD